MIYCELPRFEPPRTARTKVKALLLLADGNAPMDTKSTAHAREASRALVVDVQ